MGIKNTNDSVYIIVHNNHNLILKILCWELDIYLNSILFDLIKHFAISYFGKATKCKSAWEVVETVFKNLIPFKPPFHQYFLSFISAMENGKMDRADNIISILQRKLGFINYFIWFLCRTLLMHDPQELLIYKTKLSFLSRNSQPSWGSIALKPR